MKQHFYDIEKLQQGLILPVMEEFYTLQGEGYHTGKPAYFIRIGGCDVGCHWCDVKESWNAELYPPIETDIVVRNAAEYEAKAVVVTGGEPLMYNLDYLTAQLKSKGIKTYIETSGSHKISGQWDWVCLSPKKRLKPLQEVFPIADELKVIIESNSDFNWAENNAEKVKDSCVLFLQPEWSRRDIVMPAIIEYVKKNPKWRISLQSHKYMRIP